MATVSVKNFTRRPAPRFAYPKVVEAVLPGWELSLVFAGSTRARTLNKRLRNKTYTPNVLSYTLGKKSGEIIICLEEAARQAPAYGMSASTFVLYLFIHGLGHLAGRAHGATMERWEHKLLAQYAEAKARVATHGTTHRNRHRHRHLPGQAGGR